MNYLALMKGITDDYLRSHGVSPEQLKVKEALELLRKLRDEPLLDEEKVEILNKAITLLSLAVEGAT